MNLQHSLNINRPEDRKDYCGGMKGFVLLGISTPGPLPGDFSSFSLQPLSLLIQPHSGSHTTALTPVHFLFSLWFVGKIRCASFVVLEKCNFKGVAVVLPPSTPLDTSLTTMQSNKIVLCHPITCITHQSCPGPSLHTCDGKKKQQKFGQ